MLDIKVIIRTVGKRPTAKAENWAHTRYAGFLRGFKGYSVGFLAFDDVIKEIKTGRPAEVYSFRGLGFERIPDKGLSSKVLMVEMYESGNPTFKEKYDNIHKAVDYFYNLKESGNIETLINNEHSIKSQDKIWLLDVQSKLLHIPIPKTYYLPEELPLGKYVSKPRLGLGGKGVKKIYQLENIDEGFIIQEEISPIFAEIRLIFGPDQKFLGGKVIYDRNSPWEKEEDKANAVYSYIPSETILKDSKEVIQFSKVDVGAVDWMIKLDQSIIPDAKDISKIINSQGNHFLAEVNGLGTNFGPSLATYDLNAPVARLIAKKYLR